MALVIFRFVDPETGTSRAIPLDASPRQTHSASADVTMHNVERGSAITDHVRPMPLRLTIDGVVTNTPINADALREMHVTAKMAPVRLGYQSPVKAGVAALGIPLPQADQYINATTLTFSDIFERTNGVATSLFSAIKGGAVFDITTNLINYEDMVASGLSVPVEVESGAALHFSMEFVQIRFATTQTVTVLARQKVTKKGPQATAEAKPAEDAAFKQSVYAKGGVKYGWLTPP